MHYKALSLLLVVLLFGCMAAKEEPNEDAISRYAVTDSNVMRTLDQGIGAKEIALLSEEVVTAPNQKAELVYAVRNARNDTGVCIHTQIACRTVLKGDSCEGELGEEDAGYFWSWWQVSKPFYIGPSEVSYMKSFVNPDARQNTYLGDIILWEQESHDGACAEYHDFTERPDFHQYAKADFMLTVSY